MKSKWRCKSFLILIGILLFIGLAYAEDMIKTPFSKVRDLVVATKDLRVMTSWLDGVHCIGTIDEKYTVPGKGLTSGYALVNKMLADGSLSIITIQRTVAGWIKAESMFWGPQSLTEARAQWEVYKPIRDLLDLAIPADVPIFLEWWVTTSQYRVFFDPPTDKDIDKLNAHIVNIMFKSHEMKSGEWTEGKDKGGTFTSDRSGRWHVGKSNTTKYPEGWAPKGREELIDPEPFEKECFNCPDYEFAGGGEHGGMPYAYIKVTGGGAPHTVFLDLKIFTEYRNRSLPFIWDVDANYARTTGKLDWLLVGGGTNGFNEWAPKAYPELDVGPNWVAYPTVPGGDDRSDGPIINGIHGKDGPHPIAWPDPDRDPSDEKVKTGV